MTLEKLRKKKVYAKFHKRRYDLQLVPEIRLEGKWLEKLGFVQGVEIVIQQEQNRLVIMVLR